MDKITATRLREAYPVGDQFFASIGVNGKAVYLGRHATREQAHAAYVAAKRVHHEGCTL